MFKAVDGLYQLRNIDVANMPFIRGKTGWIVIDPLTSLATGKAALDLNNQKDVQAGTVPALAPEGHIRAIGVRTARRLSV